MTRVVLAEAWFRGSHAAWAGEVERRSRHDVTVVSLPGVHWKWRMQGGPISLARALDAVAADAPIDVLVATSAVDLSALAGLARTALRDARLVLYLHENQLTFPRRPDEPLDLTYAMATWRSMVAADLVLCNSRHHRDELFAALPGFLARFPDRRESAVIDEVAARTAVVGVGIDVDRFRRPARPPAAADAPVRILWNHRWEHDKDPARFVAALGRLAARVDGFEVVIVGSHIDVETVAADVAPIADHVVHIGAADAGRYPSLVRSCDVVVSTARHEFYGVAVAEAIAAGCAPVLPDGLAYTELLPPHLHDEVLYRDDAGLDDRLQRAVVDAAHRRRLAGAGQDAALAWDAATTVAALDDHVDRITGG